MHGVGRATGSVCEIAWYRLTPAARQLVGDLLMSESDPVFPRSCNWADEGARHYTQSHRGLPLHQHPSPR